MKFQVTTSTKLNNVEYKVLIATYEVKKKKVITNTLNVEYVRNNTMKLMAHMYKAPMQIALGNKYAFELNGLIYNITKV